jgi:uncharacterized protein (DUF885 family)
LSATQAGPDFRPLTADNRPPPKTAFDRILHELLDDLFETQPVFATRVGFHGYDDRWPDPSESGRVGRLELIRDHRARLEALDESPIGEGELIDRGITLESLDAAEFSDDVLREAVWDPLSYVYTAGSGLFSLLAREYAPWEHRGTAFIGRVRRLPEFLEAATGALTGLADRPVSLLHTETALAQLSGIPDLIDQGLAEADRQGDTQIAAALQQEASRTREAVAEFGRQLRDEIAPKAQGEGRLGAELFQEKLHHTLSSNLSYAELADRARTDHARVKDELRRLAREAWPDWMPGQVVPAGATHESADEIVRAVLDAVARVHRQPHELLEWSQAEVRRIEEFCRERNVIGLPDEPLQVTWTPVFMRAYGRAFLESPGPLDKGMPSYFWITPPDEQAGPAAVESYLREENDRMLKLLAIHEGVPGHYLQLAWSNRTPNLARAVFQSGMFAEGWAVYVTQVMMDLGYGDFEPALLLSHWKFYLRGIVNALIDIGIHTQGMTEGEAVGLMVDGAFQEQDEAAAKWLRARLTSTQLCTYYLGSLEMWDMEVAARRRAALAAGRDPDSVPPQRIAGGYGNTPDFDYRAHLEAVISHGTPPIKWVSRILSGS